MVEIAPIIINSALAAGVGFIVSFLATPPTILLAKKLSLVDDPSKNKHPKVIHKTPTPRAGSVAISIGIISGLLLFLTDFSYLPAIVLSVALLCVLGVLDDKFDLNPKIRLVFMLAIALIPVVGGGVTIDYFTNPLSGEVFNLFQLGAYGGVIGKVLAVLWIVALMNFINMGAKGIPGQMPGVVAISAFMVWLLSLRFYTDSREIPVIIMAAIASGAYLGFLPFNMFPQRIMPGFGGSMVAGLMLGTISIISSVKVGTLLLVLGIPIIDTTYTILRRIMSGKSPIWGDRGHLHHRLLDGFGLSQKQVSYFYWTTTALLGVLALTLDAQNKLYALFAVGLILAALLFTIRK